MRGSVCRNYSEGHMDKIGGGWGRKQGGELGLAGVWGQWLGKNADTCN